MDCAGLLRTVRPRCMWWHTPNGGARSKRTAGRLKAMGVRAGVPDFIFMWRDDAGTLHCGYIELKTKRGSQTAGQVEFEREARAMGCRYEIARSLTEFVAILTRWRLVSVRLA